MSQICSRCSHVCSQMGTKGRDASPFWGVFFNWKLLGLQRILKVVRREGLEPSRLAAYAPQAYQAGFALPMKSLFLRKNG